MAAVQSSMQRHLRDVINAGLTEAAANLPPSAAIIANLASDRGGNCIALCVRREVLRGVLPAGPAVTAETLKSLLSFETGDDQWRCWGNDLRLEESVSTPELMACVTAGWSVRSIRVISSSGQVYTISDSSYKPQPR